MKAKRVQDLIARRDELAKLSEALASTPEAERPSPPTEELSRHPGSAPHVSEAQR